MGGQLYQLSNNTVENLAMQVPIDPDIDALLSDICIATSAAPTYFPSYYFKNNKEEFNLIDGGIAANNPVSKIS